MLEPDGRNAILFDLIQKAETWLKRNGINHPVLKWDTRAWGENPADYDRK
jgi:ribonuclease HI